MELVMHGTRMEVGSKWRNSRESAIIALPPKPRVPFDFQGNSYGYDLMTNFEFGWSDSDGSTSSGFVTADSSPSADKQRTPSTLAPVGDSSLPHVDDADDVKYWKYSGKSLVEWDRTVREFEEFVRNRKMLSGISRLEDIGVPFLVAEIPPRALAG
jgi:hypothetical protein